MSIRQPAVAGLFYPADGAELTDLVSGLLAEARALRGTGTGWRPRR